MVLWYKYTPARPPCGVLVVLEGSYRERPYNDLRSVAGSAVFIVVGIDLCREDSDKGEIDDRVVVVADACEDLVVLGALDNILVAPVVREDSDLVLVRVVDEVIDAAIPVALPDLA